MMKLTRRLLATWLLLPLPGSSLPEVARAPLDLGSAVLAGGGTVTFLSPNNSRLLAHQGSEVRLQCQIDKPPNSAMVTATTTTTTTKIFIIVFRSLGPGGPGGLTLEREI